MLSLLRTEWMKVKNYRTFWILLALSALSIPGFSYMFYNLMNNSFPKVKGRTIFGSPFAFPDAWQTVSWNASLLFLFPAILIITLISNEYTYKTHRQNVIDGWSRGQFIRVKMIEVLFLSVFCTIIVALTALGFGALGNKIGHGQSISQESRFVVFYFGHMISYSMIAFLMAVLIKRAGLAIGAFLMYMLLENVVVGIFRINKVDAVKYLPEEWTDQLIPQPCMKALLSTQDASQWEHHISGFLIVAAVYLILYCLITVQRFLKSDL